MRITILANKDLAACYALNLLLPLLKQHQVSLYLSTRVGLSKQPKPLQVLAMAELERTILTQFESHQSDFNSFEKLNSLLIQPYEMLDNINKPEGLEKLKRSKPELIISIRFGKILKDPVIAVPKHGVINLHSGNLPQYRGVMATFWAMLNGEQSIGTTLHYVPNSGVDTGDIICQTHFPVSPDKSYQWHVFQLYKEGCVKIHQAVEAISKRQPPTAQQQPEGGNYYSYPVKEDMEKFEAMRLKLFDRQEIEQILKNE